MYHKVGNQKGGCKWKLHVYIYHNTNIYILINLTICHNSISIQTTAVWQLTSCDIIPILFCNQTDYMYTSSIMINEVFDVINKLELTLTQRFCPGFMSLGISMEYDSFPDKPRLSAL